MNRLKTWLEHHLDRYRVVHPRFISSLVMMAAAGTSAVVAIAYARIIDLATETMAFLSTNHAFAFVAASPLLFLAAYALVRYVAPEAAGSGIPQVLMEIDLEEHGYKSTSTFLEKARLVLVKIASSSLAVLGGGTVGREGPTIQISAAIFDMYDGAFKKYVSGSRGRVAMLIAGGAAGLAAAFNTPLGGVVFAIEELATEHFKSFKGILILAVVTAGYVTQAVLGPYLFIGHPVIGAVSVGDTCIGLVAASVIGVVGAIFGKALFKLARWTRTLPLKSRFGLAAGCGVVMSLVCLALGPDASGGGSLLIRKLLFESAQGSVDVSWPLAIWRIVGLAVTYASGCAGGIFAPSLAAGAGLGSLLANILSFDNHNLMIVLAMIAFLSGVTRSPFTSFILVFEMTDRQAAVMPMMAAALLANLTARMIENRSFYENMKEMLLSR